MKKYIITILLAVALIGSSCTDFLSVNEVNPNNASSVDPQLVLPTTLNDVAYTLNYPRRFDFVYLWHGLWSISKGYTQPANLVTYKLLNSDYQNAFREFYLTANNLDAIEKSSVDVKNSNYAAIAKIMKAYIFQNLVDCWGDVPYSDAFKTSTGLLKPTYDKQKDIYEDLVKQLDAAMALIQAAPADANAIPKTSDIMYAGDMSKWLKFANTLKLRILVHQAGMSGRDTYIKAAIATTSSIGYLGAGDGGLVNPGFLISAGKMNPFYGYFYNAAGSSNSDGVTYYFAGKDAVDFLNSTNDPRIAKFYSVPAGGGAYAGNIFGVPSTDASVTDPKNTSGLGYSAGVATTMIGTATKSAPLLTDFESLFIQAEAAQRGLITGDPKALYQSAVEQSFVYWGLTTTAAATYYGQANAKVNYDAAVGNPLKLIMTQKWIALNGVAPVEIWTDYRRTGYPDGLHFSITTGKQNDTPPIRLLYPQDELNVNNANVVAVGTINAFTSKIFWQNR
jgi:hypothetical protein